MREAPKKAEAIYLHASRSTKWNATTVQVDEVDGPGVDGKPGLQLGGVQMDFL